MTETKSLAAKILKVQTEVGVMSKDQRNPFFNSAYFDINQLINHLQPVLERNGLTVVQPLSITPDGAPALKTIVFDEESTIEEITPLPKIDDPQKMGAAITYYRRYALASFFLIQSEDDDGNTAAKKSPQKAAAKSQARPEQPAQNANDDFGL